jgi:L-threonylcarbamoyladenylate synthase
LTELDRCLAAGGVVVFPTDTVYGLGCDVENADAVRRLYLLKGRRPEKPAAVLWDDLDAALVDIDWLGRRTRAALAALLPGPLTALVPNPGRRYPLAGGEALGLRVPALRLDDVPCAIRDGVDLVVDGGDLPGRSSTVLDLTDYELGGAWSVLRPGAVESIAVAAALAGVVGS